MAKDANYIKLINAARWKRLRLSKLQAEPLCQRCKEAGKITSATEVHHIVSVESVNTFTQMEQLMYDFGNLMSICHECHKNIHAEMFSHSKENIQKASERRTKRFIEKYL